MLFVTLPSGRRLAYVKPRIGENRFGSDCITYECFRNDRGKFERQADSYKIKLIMQKIGGWAYSGQKKKIKGYGAQYVWVRVSDESTPQSRNLLEP
jgi:hypothetical protein